MKRRINSVSKFFISKMQINVNQEMTSDHNRLEIELTIVPMSENTEGLFNTLKGLKPLNIYESQTMEWLNSHKDEFKEYLTEKYPEQVIQHMDKFDTVLKY